MKALVPLGLLSLVLSFPSLRSAFPASASQEPRPQEGQEERREGRRERGEGRREHSELEEHMETIEHGLKSIRRTLKDETAWQAALETLDEVQRTTLLSKSLVPAAAAQQPEAERAAFVRAYRQQMIEFLKHQLELESALLEGNPEAIQAAFNTVREMEDPSHERFAPEKD